jgi:hypothetical protein
LAIIAWSASSENKKPACWNQPLPGRFDFMVYRGEHRRLGRPQKSGKTIAAQVI